MKRKLAGFTDLPLEVLICILLSLDLKDLVFARLIYRLLNTLIEGNPKIQYAIELMVAGAEDNPRVLMALSKRVDLLKQQEEAWLFLDPRISRQISLPHKRHVIDGIHLVDGVLNFKSATSATEQPTRLDYAVLPSGPERGIKWKSIDVNPATVEISSFSRPEDIFVLITRYIGRAYVF